MATVNKREWTNKDGSKSSSWRVQYKDEGGRWRRKDFERQADAKKFAETIASKVQSGEHVSAGATVTVAEIARRYVDALESGKDGKRKVEPHHVLTTRGQVENHIVPHIGALKLTALTIARVQSFRDSDLADLTDNNRRVILKLLAAICRFAISKQVMGVNPAAGEIPAKSKRGQRRVTIPSKADISLLLSTARSWIIDPPMVRSAKRPPVTPFYVKSRDTWRVMATGPDGKRFAKTYKTKEAAIAAADVIASISDRMVPAVSPRLARWGFSLIAFLVGTGCRASEARGAPRKGLDLNVATFRVFQRADAKGKIGPPKSASGVRTIHLSDLTVGYMREFLEALPSSGPLLFPNGAGKPESLSNIRSRYWLPLLKASGLERLAQDDDIVDPDDPEEGRKWGLHPLRHFRASVLRDAGLDLKEVSEELGHSSIQITQDIYGHLFKDAEAIARKVAKINSAEAFMGSSGKNSDDALAQN
jgi:integrase